MSLVAALADTAASIPPAQRGPRLVVFTAELNYTVRRNIVDLDRRLGTAQWLVLVHRPRRSWRKLLANQRANLRKHGWRWIPYQLGEAFAMLRSQPLGRVPADAPGSEFARERLEGRANLRIRECEDIHAPDSIDALRQFAPDLGLSLAAPILKPPLFSLPRLGSINLHKGQLPKFRGMPPAFWELWTNQSSVGCSVHRVNAKLDQGELLAQCSVPRERYSTPRGLQLRLDELGCEMVCAVVEDLLAARATGTAQPSEGGKTYRKPTLAQQAELRRRLAKVLPHGAPAWKRFVKEGLAHAQLVWHRWLGWRFGPPRITVLLYHRVADDVRDNLCVGVEQFERQMQLLRRHCDVLSIDEVVTSGPIARSRRPLVAVSFDDGYEDNFLNAAPVLRRHGLPCSFYVSTGIVGRDGRFPHDMRRGNPPIAVMSWDQLRMLHDWGFRVGSHTVEHIDCVAESEQRVRAELVQSRDDLTRELPRQPLYFAYPYGGAHQMNAQRLELVREAGYAACLAAFGGSNVHRVDRWQIRRRGIHWEFSDACFLQQCLGR